MLEKLSYGERDVPIGVLSTREACRNSWEGQLCLKSAIFVYFIDAKHLPVVEMGLSEHPPNGALTARTRCVIPSRFSDGDNETLLLLLGVRLRDRRENQHCLPHRVRVTNDLQ